MSEDLLYEVSDRIAEISLARLPVNALSLSLLEQLIAAFERAAADEKVRAVVLRSAIPRRFSAGLDLGMLFGKSETELRRLLDKLYVGLADAQYNLGKPSIAAVGGSARGGGMTLAVSCDVLIAGRSATFGYPEIDLGLVPAIHIVHLPRIVGRHRAFELLFSGRSFGADEAASLGLVSRVVPDDKVRDEALAMARVFATKSPTTLRLGRAAFARANDLDDRGGLGDAVENFCNVAATADAQEGLRAFIEKRPPNWQAARAQDLTYPETFRTQEIAANGTKLHVRVGGSGPAVVLLHGYGETGDMWVPLAEDLARDRTVVVPDLRGMGLSAKPAGGYDKKTQGDDVAGMLDALKIERAALVTHDIGNMVGYAFAALYRNRVTRLVLIDAPLPGVGPWEDILKNPLLWHFRFGGPDMERLVAGRERIYLDRFWNEFSATPSRFSEAARQHYAKLYARPGAMHAGFAQFAAFDQDATDNKAFVAAGKLDVPVLALGGEKSFGLTMAVVMRFAASNVEEGVVPDSGHWIMEENPKATVALVRAFLDKGR